MENVEINFAIVGSLSSKPGEAGIIRSNSSFLGNAAIYQAYSSIEPQIERIQKNYENRDAGLPFQFYCLNAANPYKTIIRAKTRFTKFESGNREYNRREYYFLPIVSDINFHSIVQGLQVPEQYESTNNQLGPLIIPQNQPLKVEKKDIIALLTSFWRKVPLINRPISEARMLNTVSALPLIFKKDLQFGLNLLSGDSYAQNKLHLYTCQDATNVSEFDQKLPVDPVIDYLADLISAQNYPYSERGEIAGDITSKDTLYSTFETHYHAALLQLILTSDTYKVGPENVAAFKKELLTEVTKGPAWVKSGKLVQILQKLGIFNTEFAQSFWKLVFQQSYSAEVTATFRQLFNDFKRTIGENKSSYKEFLLLLGTLVPDSPAHATVRSEFINTFLSIKQELQINEIEDITQAYQLKSASIPFSPRQLLDKFNIVGHIGKISDKQIELLLTPLYINDLSATESQVLLEKFGVKKALIYFLSSNGRSLSNPYIEKAFYDHLNKNLDFLAEAESKYSLPFLTKTQVESLTDNLLDYFRQKILTESSPIVVDRFLKLLIANKHGFFDIPTIGGLLQFIDEKKWEDGNFKSGRQLIANASRTYNFQLQERLPMFTAQQASVVNKGKALDVYGKEVTPAKSNAQVYKINFDGFIDLPPIGALKRFENIYHKYASNLEYWRQVLNEDFEREFTYLLTKDKIKRELLKKISRLQAEIAEDNQAGKELILRFLDRIQRSLASKYAQKHASGESKFAIIDKVKSPLIITMTLLLGTLSWSTIHFYYQSNRLTDQDEKKQKIIDSSARIIQKLNDSLYRFRQVAPFGNSAVLNPTPDTVLKQTDIHGIAKKKIKGKTLAEVVDLIFQKNPTDIKSYYGTQKELYGALLVERNKDCFNTSKICQCDSLLHIPSHSPPK